MMTQEEYMDVLAMRRRGMSFVEIGEELGYHPATISKWVRAGGPPPARTIAEDERVIDARWDGRLRELLDANEQLLARSLFEIIAAEGFEGSYPTVVRWARELRGPRFRRADDASVPIETRDCCRVCVTGAGPDGPRSVVAGREGSDDEFCNE